MSYQPSTALPERLLVDKDVQRALREHDFGRVFRAARDRAGITYSRIAIECDIKPERVGTLARGMGRITTFGKIAQIADALRVPGHMVGLSPRPWESGGSPSCPDRNESGSDVRRRTLLRATGLAASLSALHRPAVPSRVAVDDVHMLRVRTDRLRRLDEVLGGGDTFRVYLGEYQATKSLLRTCSFTEESRRCLLSLLAEQSQQAGWAAFDGGEISQAASLYEESKGLALEAGDMDLLGNGLCFLAYQTLDRADAVHMATASCATINSATPSAVQALLHERMAWACALANQAEQSERALDAARTALDSAQDGEPQPDWAAWVDGTELDIMTGRCWAELRRPLRAVPVLKQALDAYSDHNARDKALYMSWLSDAYLMAGEVEEAARVAGRALDLASGVASVRPRMRLAPVLEQLGPHQSLGAVQEALGRAVRT